MKYENNSYVPSENISSDDELLHNLDGKSGNSVTLVDMNLNNTSQLDNKGFFNSFSSSTVKRKTCTCACGIFPCPSHINANGTTININGNKSFTNLQCDKINNGTYPNSQNHSICELKTVQSDCSQKSSLECTKLNTNHKNSGCAGSIVKLEEKPSYHKNNINIHSNYVNGLKSSNKTREDVSLILNSNSRIFESDSSNFNSFSTNFNTIPGSSSKTKININKVPNFDELKLSLSSLISKDSAQNEKDSENAFQKWLSEKKKQERELRERKQNAEDQMQQEKQKKLEIEQQNFMNWLRTKKMEEKQKKDLEKRAQADEERKREDKLQREKINKKKYQLWLKLKEEQMLVKKINEQKRKIKAEELKRNRLEKNKEAFEKWLEGSKDKPKPVPLNRGLESLKASTSVAFINPMPWVPNIPKQKNAIK